MEVFLWSISERDLVNWVIAKMHVRYIDANRARKKCRDRMYNNNKRNIGRAICGIDEDTRKKEHNKRRSKFSCF